MLNAYNANKICICRYASVIFNYSAEKLHCVTEFYKTFIFPKTSMLRNIITKFTSPAGLIHVMAGYEAGCFNRDMTSGRSFLLKKTFL